MNVTCFKCGKHLGVKKPIEVKTNISDICKECLKILEKTNDGKLLIQTVKEVQYGLGITVC